MSAASAACDAKLELLRRDGIMAAQVEEMKRSGAAALAEASVRFAEETEAIKTSAERRLADAAATSKAEIDQLQAELRKCLRSATEAEAASTAKIEAINHAAALAQRNLEAEMAIRIEQERSQCHAVLTALRAQHAEETSALRLASEKAATAQAESWKSQVASLSELLIQQQQNAAAVAQSVRFQMDAELREFEARVVESDKAAAASIRDANAQCDAALADAAYRHDLELRSIRTAAEQDAATLADSHRAEISAITLRFTKQREAEVSVLMARADAEASSHDEATAILKQHLASALLQREESVSQVRHIDTRSQN